MRVSILVPAYNAERTIADTLDSALAQTYRPIEILVMDDGSTDGTSAIARHYEARGVRVYRSHNRGAATTRNRLFELSDGDYIQWLDADDLLSPEKIAAQMAVATDPRALLSCGWAWFSRDPTRARFLPSDLWTSLAPVEYLRLKIGRNLHMQPATWLVSRSLTMSVSGWNERLTLDDDGEYFSRLVAASSGTQFVGSEARVYYRRSQGLSTVTPHKLESLFLSMRSQIATLLNLEDSPRTTEACVAYLRQWLPSFYPERMDLVLALQDIGRELDADLPLPRMPWKYRWLVPVIGTAQAKRVQAQYNRVKAAWNA